MDDDIIAQFKQVIETTRRSDRWWYHLWAEALASAALGDADTVEILLDSLELGQQPKEPLRGALRLSVRHLLDTAARGDAARPSSQAVMVAVALGQSEDSARRADFDGELADDLDADLLHALKRSHPDRIGVAGPEAVSRLATEHTQMLNRLRAMVKS